jgi:hypothetical protein
MATVQELYLFFTFSLPQSSVEAVKVLTTDGLRCTGMRGRQRIPGAFGEIALPSTADKNFTISLPFLYRDRV